MILNSCGQKQLPGYDFELFSNTPVKELAQVLSIQDTIEIDRILNSGNVEIDYQEKKYGSTLLMLCVANDLKQSTRKLLQHGANPNLVDNQNGESALMISCYNHFTVNCDDTILKLLIEYGADVNAVQIKYKGNEIVQNRTVLMISVSDAQLNPCNNFVELLVNKGADINAITYDSTSCAVNSALMVNNLEAVRYLLIEKGAIIPKYALIRFPGLPDEEKVTIRQLLNEQDYSDDPYRDKIKNELIDYLESKGY